MKKVSLLLAVLLVLTCCLLAACGGDEESSAPADTSSAAASSEGATSSAAASSEKEESSAPESSVEETTSEESVESSEPVEESSDESTEEPPAGYDGDVTENPNGDNLALNKAYTGANPSTHADVSKYNAKLTDGKAAESLSYDGEWFAFYYNKDAVGDVVNAPDQVGTIVLDLEKVYAISDVKVNTYLGNIGDGILPPKSIKVEYSADGTNYTSMGEQSFEKPDDAAKDKTIKWVEFNADGAAAQYIRITVTMQGTFVFINEIEVH